MCPLYRDFWLISKQQEGRFSAWVALSFTPMALSPMIALKKLFIKLLAALLVSTAVSVRARRFYYPIVTTYPYISSPVEPGGQYTISVQQGQHIFNTMCSQLVNLRR